MQVSKNSVQRGKVALIMFAALLNGGCGCNNSGSNPSPADYEKIVSTFTVGAVALETGDPDHTLASLTKMTKLAPDEPAGWANLGLYQLRNSQYKEATASLDKAAKLQSKPHPGIERLLALLADHNGNLPEAIQHYQKAIELEPDELRTRYSLCEIYSRQATPEAETAYQAEILAILAKQPYNLVAQIALAKIAAKRGDDTAFKQAVGYLDARSATFAPDVMERLKELNAAMASGDMKAAARTIPFLGNLLSQNSGFRMSSNALKQDSQDGIGAPIQQFIVLPKIPQNIAPEDIGITFKAEPVAKLSTGTSKYTNAFWLDEKGAQVLLSGDGRSIRLDTGATLPFPGGAKSTPPTPNGVLAIDTNYDLKNDLIFAGAGGLKLFLQTKDGAFTDATSKSKLPASILQGAYNGAWSCDIEADGDLDVVLGTASGAPVVLQNNGDDTWNVIHPFTGVSGVQDFAWVDLDGDGSSEAALIDGSGKAHIFMNQRAGIFKERALPESLGAVSALTVSEMNSDGKLDLLALKPDGAIVRISDSSKGADWEIVEVARWKSPPGDIRAGSARLIVADLDNNGGLDMIASTPKGSQVWLRGVKELFVPLQTPLSEQIFAALDLEDRKSVV